MSDNVNFGLDWKTRVFIVGGAVGALVGVGAAYLYVRRIEESGDEPAMATKDAMSIGFSLVSLLKQISNIGG